MARTPPQTTATVKPQVPSVAPSNGVHPLLAPYPKPSGLQPAQFTKLTELCGPRLVDLLFHLPRSLLDRSAIPPIATAPIGQRATFLVTVTRRPPLPPRHIKRPLSIELTDDHGTALRAIYFNPGAWLERAYPTGQQVIVSGKVEEDAKGKKLIHPDVWAIPSNPQKSENHAENKLAHIARLTPLYPATAGLPQGWIARAISTALQQLPTLTLPEWHPNPPPDLPSFTEALTQAHSPQSEADLHPTHPARQRLALDELLSTQLSLMHARMVTRTQAGLAQGNSLHLTTKLMAALPWPPTSCQSSAIASIRSAMHSPAPMLHLLQGDVGAGKTLVALMALLHTIENGHQGCLMAPTEILAQQHFATAQQLLQPLGITVALLTGRLTPAQKTKLKQHLASGFVNLLIGTQALIQSDVAFDKLGLVVIDEQHRFGVAQRLSLTTKGFDQGPASTKTPAPDTLLMTATPIPRTLALTAYGDIDTSILRTKPPGRQPIRTVVMGADKLPTLAASLQRILDKGEQVYWVCPAVEEDEDTENQLTAATTRHAHLQGSYGPLVGLLHGQMKAAEKDAAMATFKKGETKILVATTVIEVGVDVPQATTIVIEHAERFGLSQLHQLRGRVGRGRSASQCVLLYHGQLTPFAQERLAALRDSDDGFYLAEKDLELRGAGELMGTRQSGQQVGQLVDFFHHSPLIPLAQQSASALLTAPLSPAQRRALALLMQLFGQDPHTLNYLRSG